MNCCNEYGKCKGGNGMYEGPLHDKQLEATITKLREAAAKAQTEGFNLDLHLGRSRAYATAHAHKWSVRVKSGDLLRILDALEKTK